ncbi:HD domain-containing protein [Candidatus Uhrbacteria bacterium]|nr:HD domain-containing protein [Candidatus Uhrbacteria bacterium]
MNISETDKKNKYVVYVDDNFHFMDESERYALGAYDTLEEATEQCMRIADDFLFRAYKDGMEPADLTAAWSMFGDDPWITEPKVKRKGRMSFSAANYVKRKAHEICRLKNAQFFCARSLVIEKIKGARKGCEEPAYEHSIRVSDTLAKNGYSQETVIAGLLHDIIEDGGVTMRELLDLGFTERVVSLVDTCSHDSTIENKDARWTKMIARLIDMDDKEAWAIKCADLLDNCRSCHTMPDDRAAFIRTVKAPLLLAVTKDILGQCGIWEDLFTELNAQKYGR